VLGQLGSALHVPIQRRAPDQPGSADLDTFDAAFSHHASHVFDVVLELFGSLFCGDEPVQIRHDSLPLRKGTREEYIPSRVTIILIYSAPKGILYIRIIPS
jgi:hypothetical protein